MEPQPSLSARMSDVNNHSRTSSEPMVVLKYLMTQLCDMVQAPVDGHDICERSFVEDVVEHLRDERERWDLRRRLLGQVLKMDKPRRFKFGARRAGMIHVPDAPRNNSAEKLYLYCTCGNRFKWKTSLSQHIESFTSEWKFKCKHDQCTERFYHFCKLKYHLKQKHKMENPLQEYETGCSFCGLPIRTRAELLDHQKTKHKIHETPKVAQPASFPRASGMTPRRRSRKSPNQKGSAEQIPQKLLRCKCNEQFSSFKQLKQHISVHKMKTNRLECPSCSRKFIYNCEFMQHRKLDCNQMNATSSPSNRNEAGAGRENLIGNISMEVEALRNRIKRRQVHCDPSHFQMDEQEYPESDNRSNEVAPPENLEMERETQDGDMDMQSHEMEFDSVSNDSIETPPPNP